jgi:hypothetical protein
MCRVRLAVFTGCWIGSGAGRGAGGVRARVPAADRGAGPTERMAG